MNQTEQRARPPRPAPATEPRIRLTLARAALAWERLWPALWPAAGVAGLFVAVALLDVLPSLGFWVHGAILLLFAAALAAALAFAVGALRVPDGAAARRRLERDSGLDHRPLQTMTDHLAAGAADPIAAAAWQLHQERARRRVMDLHVRPPHPNLAARDPWAIRAVVMLALVVAVVGSWGDWGARLLAAINPRFTAVAAVPAVLDIWVTPPEYTGLPPTFLKTGSATATAGAAAQAVPAAVAGPVDAADRVTTVPAGSTILARVSGGSRAPRLTANDATTDFTKIEDGTFQVSQAVQSGTVIAVDQDGGRLGAWQITVVPTHPPTIAFASPPSASERGALRLDYKASDDYGLATIGATIRLDDQPDGASPAKPIELPLSLPNVHPKQAHGTSYQDLTAHPWAGLPVTIRLSATNGAGLSGTSDDVAIVLPERIFHHPVARAIVAERKKLTQGGDKARDDVGEHLSNISVRPGDFYGDIVVFLGLRTAVARLVLDPSPEAIPAIQALLWDLALRVEDGGVSIAQRELRDAEQALRDALDRNAPDAELKRLMDQVQAALDKFLNEMEKNLAERLARGEKPETMPFDPNRQMIDRKGLQRMLDQMRQMAETGARDAARQMLSQLEQMMENLRAGVTAGNQPGEDQAMDLLRDLQNLTQDQQKLLDETFRESQEDDGGQQDMNGQMPSPGSMPGMPGRQGQRGQKGHGSSSQQAMGNAQQQEALRHRLGELMRRLGEMAGDIPRPLGRAERSMRDAEQALGRGQPDSAVPPQTQALDALQQGLQAFVQQLNQQAMGQQGQPGQPSNPRSTAMPSSRDRDPLGRWLPNNGLNTEDVKIPEKADLQRAREILDELRRRSSEFGRPPLERSYIDRLLHQF